MYVERENGKIISVYANEQEYATERLDDDNQELVTFLELSKLPPAQTYSSMRLKAYQMESDPLFFKWQRGEIDKQVWLDKVAEIKARLE